MSENDRHGFSMCAFCEGSFASRKLFEVIVPPWFGGRAEGQKRPLVYALAQPKIGVPAQACTECLDKMMHARRDHEVVCIVRGEKKKRLPHNTPLTRVRKRKKKTGRR